MYTVVNIFRGVLYRYFFFVLFFLSRCPADDRCCDTTPSYIFTRDNFQVYRLQSVKAQQDECLRSKHNVAQLAFKEHGRRHVGWFNSSMKYRLIIKSILLWTCVRTYVYGRSVHFCSQDCNLCRLCHFYTKHWRRFVSY